MLVLLTHILPGGYGNRCTDYVASGACGGCEDR
nr:MAG TPA: hypothetical protein [Caudoviricetes sp.]